MKRLKNWLLRVFGGPIWKLQIDARVELAEAMIGDLRERFTRFQNRENMRKARAATDEDADLADEAAALIGGASKAAETASSQAKLDLWKRRH